MLSNRMQELINLTTGDNNFEEFCSKLIDLIKADSEAIKYKFKETTLDGDVKPGNWKVAIVAGKVLDPSTGKTKNVYHFYRLEKTGDWSQKPGKYAPTFRDSSGEYISDPKTADKSIQGGEYTRFLGYYEVGPNE